MKERRKENLKLNVVFNALYQILILIVPLITTPYISTVFSSGTIGSYSFAFSTVQYFVLAADFGFTMYGTTIIAKARGNDIEERKGFWSIFYCKIFLDITLLLLYFVLVFSGAFNNQNYPLNTSLIYILLSLPIFGALCDTTFLFQGKEKFINLCVRNLIVKVVCTILIFIFVQVESDYPIYVAIMGSSYLFSGVITIISTPFMIGKPLRIPFRMLFLQFKQSLIFFIPSVATTIYTIASKTLLGVITGNSSISGYYEQANKIVDIITTIVNSLNTIMMARMAYLYATKNYTQIEIKTRKVMQLYCILSLSCFFGLMAINDYLTLGFLGDNFAESIPLIYILGLKILIVPGSGILGAIYYIPNNQVKKRSLYLVSGAVFNIVFNSFLVYLFDSIGACIASILTEILVTFLYWQGARKHLSFAPLKKDWILCLDSALIMFVLLLLVKSPILSALTYSFSGIASMRILYFASAIILVVMGVTIYFLLLLLFKEPFVVEMFKKVFSPIYNKITRRHRNGR